MHITLGSKNPIKIIALKEVLGRYDLFKDAVVNGASVSSGVAEQPLTLEETIRGAKNRAEAAYVKCDYSFGLEGGLAKIPHTKSGYMQMSACAIYDGEEFHMGLASGFELPKRAVDLLVNEGKDLSQAWKEIGLTTKEDIGAEEGSIGMLTNGRVNRKEYAQQSIINALIHLENSHMF